MGTIRTANTHTGKKLRLKRKFKVLAVLAVIILGVTFYIPSVIGLNDASSLTMQKYIQVEVQYGDTLWDIADEYMPDDIDTRRAVYILANENKLEDKSVYPGQILNVPEYI